VMRQEVERLKRVTRDVLDFARPRPGDARGSDVAQSVSHLLALARKRLEEANVQVTTDLADVPRLAIEPEHLTMVLMNLVVNALQAMDGMHDGRLHIAADRTGEHVVVTLTDNGPPIPEDVLPHVFEPFYTTKSDGTGLGLWVSRELLAEAGSIEVHNLEGGQGVVFRVKVATQISST